MRVQFLTLICAVALPLMVQGTPADYEIIVVDAANHALTLKLNGEVTLFRIRQGADVTINGIKATLEELEPGMRVKVTLAEPGIAQRLVANGSRTPLPTAREKLAPSASQSQAGRALKATIPANSADAFVIGDVRKGTKITFRYVGGKWKSWGRLPTANPDEEEIEGGEKCRLALALPNGEGGDVVAIIPPGTGKRGFIFEAKQDYPGLVLRINSSNFKGNPGEVEYEVRIEPPPG